MYTIGEFSRINRVTTKTLRHYDKIGLLKPSFTDEWTGYRFYSSDQLGRMHSILIFKEMGFSLEEIKGILSGDSNVEALLDRRCVDLENEIADSKRRLTSVKVYLNSLKRGEKMNNEVVIKSLPEVIAASMRTKVPGYDTYFDIVPKMGEYMASVGAVCREPAYCFTIYHDGEYRDSDIDVEICEAVVAPCQEGEKVKFKTIEGVEKAACLIHRGDYNSIGTTYSALFNWIKENQMEVIGNPRESYIDGIWNKDDPAQWTTEIQIPVN